MTVTTEIRSITRPADGSTEFESVYCRRNDDIISPLKTSFSYDTSIISSPSTISSGTAASTSSPVVSLNKSSFSATGTTQRTRSAPTPRNYTYRQRQRILKQKTPLSARQETGINLKKIRALPARYGEFC